MTRWQQLGISEFDGLGNLSIFVMSSEVKTAQKWLFSISALRLFWPFSFKGETQFPS